MTEDIIELDVVHFYSHDEIDLFSCEGFVQAVVQLTHDSFNKIIKIVPKGKVFRELINSVTVIIPSEDTVILTGKTLFRLNKYVNRKSGKIRYNIAYIGDKEKRVKKKVEDETNEDELLSLSTDQLFILLGKLQYEVSEIQIKIKRIRSILYNKKYKEP